LKLKLKTSNHAIDHICITVSPNNTIRKPYWIWKAILNNYSHPTLDWCLFVYIEITNNLQVATTFNPIFEEKKSKSPYLDNTLLEVAKTKGRFVFKENLLSNLWSNLAHSSCGLLPVHLFHKIKMRKTLLVGVF
jgi:hypothetical protein